MSLALSIEVHNHHVSYAFIPSIGCVLELLLFSSCPRARCHVTVLSLHVVWLFVIIRLRSKHAMLLAMYWYLSEITSDSQSCNIGYLHSGHPVFT